MKNKTLTYAIATAIMLTGCGDSRVREVRGEFIEGCTSGGTKRDVCACIFKKIEGQYSADQILDMKIGIVPNGFVEFTTQASLQCVKDN